jgi:hypothetical protein
MLTEIVKRKSFGVNESILLRQKTTNLKPLYSLMYIQWVINGFNTPQRQRFAQMVIDMRKTLRGTQNSHLSSKH